MKLFGIIRTNKKRIGMGLFDGISKNVFVLGLVSFLTDVSSEMIFPILPIFLSSILGAGKGIIGTIEGIADSLSSLCDILFGYWSDKWGNRKQFVIAGYGLSAILKVGIYLSTTWQQLMFIRGAERVGKSLRTSPRDAIIADSVDEKQRGRAFGLHRAMDTLGAIVGPAIAYIVLTTLGNSESGYRTVFSLALIPAALAVIVILLVREPKQKSKIIKPRFFDALAQMTNQYKIFLKISCLFSLAYFSFALLIVKANEVGLGPTEIILVYLLYNIVYVIASVPVGVLSDKIGRVYVISGSFLLYGLICIGFIFAKDIVQIAVLFSIYGVFVATDESVNKAYISDLAPSEKRGIALGAYNSAVGAVYLPASVMFGTLWTIFGATIAFGTAAGISLIAGLIMLGQNNTPKKGGN